MTTDIEQIKKKIIYRSNYRGTKEMDKLLGSFTNKYLNELDISDLKELLKLLEVAVFKTGAFNRSAISPCKSFYN